MIAPRRALDPGRYQLRIDAPGLADLEGDALGAIGDTGTPSGVS